jgi:hypothetical protein
VNQAAIKDPLGVEGFVLPLGRSSVIKSASRNRFVQGLCMRKIELPSHEAAILSRIAGPDKPALSAAAARGILTLGFSPADQDRMHALAAKAREGTLTSDEQAEVEAYSRVGSLLGILKSKARRAIKLRTSNDNAKTH